MMDISEVVRRRSEFTGPHDLIRTSDGKTLFLRRWDPPRARGVSVLIFHGITAYSEPYGPMVAETLANAGCTVYGLDLRGHGLSDGVRGDYPSPTRYAADLSEAVAFVRARSPKLVLLGHSLGVLSALLAQQVRPNEVDGLVLLSAAKTVRVGVWPRPSRGQVLKVLVGVTILRGRPLIEYHREGMIGLEDPLFNFRYSARFYRAAYGVGALRVARMFGRGTIDSPYLHPTGGLRVPLLVAVGDQDEAFPVESVRAFCEGFDAGDKRFFVIPGAHHAVFPEDSWGPLVTWLDEKF